MTWLELTLLERGGKQSKPKRKLIIFLFANHDRTYAPPDRNKKPNRLLPLSKEHDIRYRR